MSGRTVVVDRNNGVHILFAEGTHQVVGTLLHLWVGTLNGVQLDTVRIATCINRRYRTTTQADTVVITTNHDDLVTLLGLLLQAVALGAVTYTTCQHDYLIVSVFLLALLMLEGQNRTTDQRLTELIAEV